MAPRKTSKTAMHESPLDVKPLIDSSFDTSNSQAQVDEPEPRKKSGTKKQHLPQKKSAGLLEESIIEVAPGLCPDASLGSSSETDDQAIPILLTGVENTDMDLAEDKSVPTKHNRKMRKISPIKITAPESQQLEAKLEAEIEALEEDDIENRAQDAPSIATTNITATAPVLPPHARTVLEAISKGRALELIFLDSESNTPRTFEARQLIFDVFTKAWFIWGWDRRYNAERHHRLDQLAQVNFVDGIGRAAQGPFPEDTPPNQIGGWRGGEIITVKAVLMKQWIFAVKQAQLHSLISIWKK